MDRVIPSYGQFSISPIPGFLGEPTQLTLRPIAWMLAVDWNAPRWRRGSKHQSTSRAKRGWWTWGQRSTWFQVRGKPTTNEHQEVQNFKVCVENHAKFWSEKVKRRKTRLAHSSHQLLHQLFQDLTWLWGWFHQLFSEEIETGFLS